MELLDRLRLALGDTYTIERELGGGGMSRVFVAEEKALGRRVVLKVLPQELSGAVNVERFKREIQLAAGLQHACVVPVLSAGVADELPYYTMPFVAGESLRSRITQEGQLSLTECVRVLRDVTAAIAHAHAAGIVHRDIKPDNVLLSGGYAVVTDFGVAKAITSAAAGDSNVGLTAVGVAMGTPAYMAPEQAAAEEVDHRADIYALGAMAYELVAGRPPFNHRTASAMLAAHLTEAPEPLETHRPDVTPELADLVMRCLAKDPADRPQTAREVLATLDALATPGTGTVTGLHRHVTPGRALGLWAAVSAAEVVLARLAVNYLGLPDWVFSGALLLALLALPLVGATALAHSRAPTNPISGAPTGTFRRRKLTWRRTVTASGIAFGAFVALVAVYMSLRAFGIGPAGSLLAKGVLADRDRILVADFQTTGADTSLGTIVTEAFRTDLGQSKAVSVVPPSAVRQTLALMRRPLDTRLDVGLAREIAARDGIKAIVAGDVTPVGGGFVLTARLVASSTGDAIASFRETATNPAELIPAIEKLSKKLRTRIGESIRGIRAEPALAEVTTHSLEALKKYAQGSRTADEGDPQRGIALLEEAVKLDTGFAMAYRKLAVVMNNNGIKLQRADSMAQRAYLLRERLPEREKYMAEAYYHSSTTIGYDPEKAIAAYRSLLDVDSVNSVGLNNLALLLLQRRQYAGAESLLVRAGNLPQATPPSLYNVVNAQFNQGKIDQARASLARARQKAPRWSSADQLEATFLASSFQYDSAHRFIDSLRKVKTDPTSRIFVEGLSSTLAQLEGRIGDAERHDANQIGAERERTGVDASLVVALSSAYYDAWYRENRTRALARAEEALRKYPMTALPPLQRPYALLSILYAFAGRPDKARVVLNEMDAAFTDPTQRRFLESTRVSMLYAIQLAEGHGPEAATTLRSGPRDQQCEICEYAYAGYAYDRAGMQDSTLMYYQKYLDTPWIGRQFQDAQFLAGVHKRLGELYEARGDRERAVSHYQEFVQLWKNADAELQPKVKAARERIAALKPLTKG
jgi:tetratricopeptide (TPR) repeat protein/tRNA A-37 threonylcarbamoyl transferase component Bud32